MLAYFKKLFGAAKDTAKAVSDPEVARSVITPVHVETPVAAASEPKAKKKRVTKKK